MSIIEVAKEAGVSKSTVSRVINYSPGVSEAHRQAVLAAMKTLNYQPSSRRPGPKPASHRGVRTGNVLMLFVGCQAGEVYQMPVFPSLLHGVETALADVGMNLVIAGLHPGKPIPAALSSGQVDGVLIMGFGAEELSTKVTGILKSLPTIVLMRDVEQAAGQYDRVLYNNRAVGLIAAEYVLSQGHTHAAFINADASHLAYPARQRVFARTMREGGGRCLNLATESNESDPQDVMNEFVARIKAELPSLSAICISSDAALPHLYRSLIDAGIKPQEDVQIVSCDNEDRIISTLKPRPATIDIQAEYMGQIAVRQLQWRLALSHDAGPISVVVEPTLIPSPD